MIYVHYITVCCSRGALQVRQLITNDECTSRFSYAELFQIVAIDNNML